MLTSHGHHQGELNNFLLATQTLVNEMNTDKATDKTLMDSLKTQVNANTTLTTELRADHATFKTAVDETETLIEELHDDHATFKTAVDQTETLIEELHDDHATFKTVCDDMKALANGLRLYMADGMLVHSTLLITAAPEKFKTTTTAVYTISGVTYTKAAEDNLTFTAAYTINTGAGVGLLWGAFLVQVNAAGVISTKAVAADQVYATEAEAIAALPVADALNVALGYITVQAKTGTDWVANTDDMTAAGDCETATFYNIAVKALPAAVSSSAPATLTAPKPASAPATLTAPKPSSAPATITAAAAAAVTVSSSAATSAAALSGVE